MATQRSKKQEIIETGHVPTTSQAESVVDTRTMAPQASASPLDLPSKVFRAGLDRRKQNREALMEWIRASLVERVDYGRIHSGGKTKCEYATQGRAEECPNQKHWSKPSLFKSGAEKICGMLGVTVHYPALHEYELAALQGVELKHVIIRCEIKDAAGRVVADGAGARSLAQDDGDLNKALKMSEKSAHIDATLRMAGLSEVFTQDLEDMAPGGNRRVSPKNMEKNRVQGAQGGKVEEDQMRRPQISPAQHRHLETRIKELGLNRKRVNNWLKQASKGRIKQFTDMTQEVHDILCAKLDEWARQMSEEQARTESKAIQR